MQLTLTQTNQFDFINGTRCRVWIGQNEEGTEIIAYIPLLLVRATDDCRTFDRDLIHLPSRPR